MMANESFLAPREPPSPVAGYTKATCKWCRREWPVRLRAQTVDRDLSAPCPECGQKWIGGLRHEQDEYEWYDYDWDDDDE